MLGGVFFFLLSSIEHRSWLYMHALYVSLIVGRSLARRSGTDSEPSLTGEEREVIRGGIGFDAWGATGSDP